jgi:hypothetical protein
MRTRAARALIGFMVVAVPVGWATTATARAAPLSGSIAQDGGTLFYTGNAYGTYANVGNTVVSGKSALITFGCTTTAGQHFSNTIASVHIPSVLDTGAVNSTGATIATTGSVASTTSADVHGVSLLGGVITATEVAAVSTTSNDSGGFHFDSTGTGIVNLAINGVPVTVAPPPNTTVPLPGIGSVVLNEQIQHQGPNAASFTVNMIHVTITASLPGITAGTQVVVAHAASDLELNKSGRLDGVAYGSTVNLSNVVVSGRMAVQYMPCGGTGGRVLSNSVASVTVPGVVTSGTVVDTAQGRDSATFLAGETTSTIQGLNLGGGLITADLIKADANASNNGGVVLSDTGSQFVNLVVNGTVITDPVAPNTVINNIPGITIWLHRVIQRSNSIQVRMIELIVTGPNAGGLQLGLDVRVAVAEASVH